MLTTRTKVELRQQLSLWRERGDSIAIVPTMGNLHDGHLSLLHIARSKADRVVATVFVNPTQFGEGEDFDDYPRSLEKDSAKLSDESVDLLFAPDIATVYPFGIDNATQISVPGLTDEFCGLGRPGHFDGVATVVMRLFALVQPDIAVFGQKDYQQQLMIRRMVADIGLPIEIVTGPVIREANGLAMSSRNSYLDDDERHIAETVFRILHNASDSLQVNTSDFAALETEAQAELEQAGMQLEYFAIRNAENLERPDATCNRLVILAAVRIGKVRLIDNVLVNTS